MNIPLTLILVAYAAVAGGWVGYIYRERRRPRLKQFYLTFTGKVDVMLMAHKYTDDGQWQRYLDDRGVELLRLPTSWKAENAGGSRG